MVEILAILALVALLGVILYNTLTAAAEVDKARRSKPAQLPWRKGVGYQRGPLIVEDEDEREFFYATHDALNRGSMRDPVHGPPSKLRPNRFERQAVMGRAYSERRVPRYPADTSTDHLLNPLYHETPACDPSSSYDSSSSDSGSSSSSNSSCNSSDSGSSF